MKKIVFVTGVHGVGKSYTVKKISSLLSIPCYSASSLIEKYNYISKTEKTVENIFENQGYLLEAINECILENFFILDGHSVLINSRMKFEKIPFSVFQSLNVCLIVLISDDPRKIVERLEVRDSKKYSINFVKKFQKKEMEYDNYLSKKIKIPFVIYRNGDNLNNLLKMIGEFLNE